MTDEKLKEFFCVPITRKGYHRPELHLVEFSALEKANAEIERLIEALKEIAEAPIDYSDAQQSADILCRYGSPKPWQKWRGRSERKRPRLAQKYH